MSKLTGNQEFNGNVYVKDIGGYNGDNPLSSLTLQDAVNSKASLNSPNFTGTPTAPMALPGDSSTQIANTRFVASEIQSAMSETPFVASSGISSAVLANADDEAAGDYAIAVGYSSWADGDCSFAEGEESEAAGTASHAEGNKAVANGDASHAEGYNTETGGNATGNTRSLGTGSTPGNYAHAEGNATIAKGVSSHAEGRQTFASGEASHAEGSNTLSSGQNAHAEGYQTSATTTNAHAEGQATAASGQNAHAEGRSNVASEQNSHVEGYQNLASGVNSHAEGRQTSAITQNTHAEGRASVASGGEGSHAEGYGTEATHNQGEHAEGKYNKSNADTISSIGIGTSASNRANAFEVTTGGSIFVKGIGGYDGTNPSSSTTLQDVVNNSGGIVGTGVTAIVALSESEYEALSSKSSTTLYIVTPDPTPVTNWIKLSGLNNNDPVEVGSGYDPSDLTNNPPVLYDANNNVLEVADWRSTSSPFGDFIGFKLTSGATYYYIYSYDNPQYISSDY